MLGEIRIAREIIACRAASTRRGTLGSGFEGLAVLRSPGAGKGYRLIVAQQRGWDYTTPPCENLDDDDGGLNARNEPNRTRLWIFDPKARDVEPRSRGSLRRSRPMRRGWGCRRLRRFPTATTFVLIERDNRTGDFAALEDAGQDRPRRDVPTASCNAEKVHLRPAAAPLKPANGWITDKPEGVAITANGETFVVTDNDGVDDWSGETWFFDLGITGRCSTDAPSGALEDDGTPPIEAVGGVSASYLTIRAGCSAPAGDSARPGLSACSPWTASPRATCAARRRARPG